MLTSSRFTFMNLGNFPERKFEIVIFFKVENLRIPKTFRLTSQQLSPKLLLELVEKMEQDNIHKISLNRPIMKFVKNDRQFISFEKLNQENYHFLLERDLIEIEYLYRNKRDEVAKKITRFQNQVLQKHAYLMQISKDQSSKIDLLKRLASKKSGLQSDTSLQIKIKITLFISDPLVRNKSIPVGHEQIDIQEHIKVLKQASNAQKSLIITVDKHYACEQNISSVFGEEVSSHPQHKKLMRIVHFFTKVIKKNNDLFIVFEDRKSFFGEEKLISVKDFFQRIKKSPINMLIFIGNNVNLLSEQIKSRSLQFSVLLLSTFNPNAEQAHLSFLKTFYEQVFDRSEIGKSISIAQEEYKRNIVDSDAWKNNIVCCCLHQHAQNCAWTKIVQRTGIKLAHKMHFHKNIRDTTLKYVNTELQKILLNQLELQADRCATLQDICCQQSHVKKSLIMEKKILYFPNQSSSLIFTVSQNFRDFIKNQFHIKMAYQKISPSRRCPLIIYQIVKKILSNKGKIIEMGSRRVGKSYFIQAASKYIQSRKCNYEFQNIDLNEGSLQQCIKYMYSKAEKHKNEKKMVFIYHNNAILIEKQYLRYFKQNKNTNLPFLPFTFIIKTQEEENSMNTAEENLQTKNMAYITIPRLRKFDIICQVYYQLGDYYLEENKNLPEILNFCKTFDNKLSYRNVRSFLKYFNEKQSQIRIGKGKSLEDVYSDMTIDFFKRMQIIKTSNKNLFDFLGFISQFPQGIYLTKLNQLLLKEIFGIEDLKTIMKNKENVNYFFEVIQKVNFVKAVNIKSEKIDFVIPEDKIISYFKHLNVEISDHFHQMKCIFFNYFFTVLETLIFENINIVGNRLKKQRVFLDQGIFLFNYRKNHLLEQELNKKDKILGRLIKNAQSLYSNQVDLKILYENEFKQKISSAKINDPNTKSRLLKQKTISIILHESQRYVLYRHLSNLTGIIFSVGKKPDTPISEKNQKSSHHKHWHQGKLSRCPIIFYKKMYLVYRLLLKQPQKYQQLKNKLKNIEPKLVHFYQSKGSQILTQLVAEQERNIENKKSHVKSTKTHKSFHFTGQQAQTKQKPTIHSPTHIDAESYFQKLINFLQIEILINRKQTFSLSFNEYGGKRKSGNQMNKDKAKFQKSCFQKSLQNLLPKIRKEVRSEQLISINLAESTSKLSQNTLLWTKPSEYKLLSCQELIILILHKLLLYECQEQYINYFYDLEEILGIIDRQIKLFDAIISIQAEIQNRNIHQNLNEKYRFLSCINKEQLTMQVLRLHMRKIEIHFRLKKQRKSFLSNIKVEQNVERLIDLKSFEYLQTYCKILQSSCNDSRNLYFNSEKVHKLLKNAQICQKYIHSVCENDKVTEEFTTLIGQVDNDYKEMFSYLCQQAWKKMLFNQTNNIIFFKSRVIVFQNKPHTYVRKRNITMKYIKKMLSEIKINITFLHLTRNNFNYIQIDKKQNPNCKIKYLILTVDTEVINNEIYLIFEQQNNITHDMVKLDAFLQMMNMVNVEFIIIMGKRASMLAEAMSRALKTNPIIVGLENSNSEFGLDNFVEYVDPVVINEEDQFLPNDNKDEEQSVFLKRIYKYLDIECYHCLLDMIVCTLVSNLVQITQQRNRPLRRSSYQNEQHIVCSYKKIQDIVIKSINLAKEIMRTKWQSARQIDIEYVIFPFTYEADNTSVLRKNFSMTVSQSSQMPLTHKFSNKEAGDVIRYFPHFQKGSIIDNTIKLYESPLNLQDEEYYENVNRNQQLFSIMSFIQHEGRRVVEIFGSDGSGKSCFLREICWINQTYRLFKDGVYMFDAKTLLNNSQTLMWHIQIFYKDHKLFSILQEDFTVQKTDPSTFLLALDNLDSQSIRENHDFFQKIKGKPICLIYSTNCTNLSNELRNYMYIDPINTDNLKKKHSESHESINPNIISLFSQKNLGSHHHHSLSQSLDRKRSDESSLKQSTSENSDECWSYLRVDINNISKSALFNIALSFLKKEELGTLKVGMKEFITKSFSVFLTDLFKQMFDDQMNHLPKSFSIADRKRLSASEPMSQQLIQSMPEHQQIERPHALQKMRSQVTSNQVKGTHRQTSQAEKLIRKLEDYFRSLSEDRVSLSTSASSIQGSEVQKVPIIGNLSKNILGPKRDSRLWFYEDCFEQLMILNNTYDQMKVVFK